MRVTTSTMKGTTVGSSEAVTPIRIADLACNLVDLRIAGGIFLSDDVFVSA